MPGSGDGLGSLLSLLYQLRVGERGDSPLLGGYEISDPQGGL